ncbi:MULTISPECIES: chemotaxis protein CheD [unclassified Novosphingobium]|uniref:chemotaxis protein CheD n=1 Tax=unclassified Novosphingobium TaxID=2644732 RepID=UPI000D324465|nr:MULTISPECIES: chemotaxis protein CheD [unclassified Novosphingobium]PTR05579.1 chemotaxis protein CheD [Novosphingobium sp. GV055]PUA94133.1 chemotaxis protein CheD [Novosphingobium sp. GV061]PUB11900.1 chemotaxis protein CheD [Novosphingobium sp. GV079]PUB37161.1 chemotaxis protein CheD [Novosphingobium sp. GV027]
MFHKPILPNPSGLERVTVMQGQALASADKSLEYSTVLGSCVATCLFDPDARVGGMNHFLLAEPPAGYDTAVDEHYGLYLMELLVNEMLAKGARKSKLKAHLYGGANVNRNMMKIGSVNAEFARKFLANEGIALLREDLGGTQARRVDFRPASGQVRLRTVEDRLAPPVQPTARPAKSLGDVELF